MYGLPSINKLNKSTKNWSFSEIIIRSSQIVIMFIILHVLVLSAHKANTFYHFPFIYKYNLFFFAFQTKPHTDNPVRVRARKSHIITEESAVTSTTSDDSDKEGGAAVPLSDRLKTDKKELDNDVHLSKRTKKGKKRISNNTTSDQEFQVIFSNSSSLSDVQDENFVSSATSHGSEENKRKKRRNDQTRKKIRLSSLGNKKKKNTARNNLNSRQLDDR